MDEPDGLDEPEEYALTPLAGGHSGETFVSDGAGERAVVRLYLQRGADRGPEAPAVDAGVLALVRGLLPVPRVLEVRRRPSAEGPGLLVTSWLPGTRLDLLLPALGAGERTVVGHALGVLLGRLAGMPLPRRGLFVDADLRTEPLPGRDLADVVRLQREGTAIGDWPAAAYDDLLGLADRAQTLLDPVTRTCLVHGDLNPKNVLADPDTLEVTGLVDWEFAHAGVPGADLGNLLRFERDPDLTDAVLAAYRDRVPDAREDTLDLARAADLPALVDLAARRGGRGHSPVSDRAEALLRAMAASGDLAAWP